MPSGVIFDMDGVLVNSGPAHAASWRILAARHGISMTDADFAGSFGQTSRDIVRRFWGESVTSDEIKHIDDEKEAIYRDSIRGNIPLMPGVTDLLRTLRDACFVLAVASSGPPENIHLVLEEGHLALYFAAVVTGFDIKHGKPAPDCFLLAAERAGLPPAHCVVVEDAPVGIQAALAAGMPAIGLTGTHPTQRLREAGAAMVIDHLSEITPDVIRILLEHKP